MQAWHVRRFKVALGRYIVIDSKQRAGFPKSELACFQRSIGCNVIVFLRHGSKVMAIRRFYSLRLVGFGIDVVPNKGLALQVAQLRRN